MYCSACGRPVSATGKFCTSCGAAVGGGAPAAITITRPGKQTDLDGFVITAVPVTHGSTGFRAFCADASQTICFTRDGRAPSTDGGRCGACAPLQ